MWVKIFLPFVGLLWGSSLPVTFSQTATSPIFLCSISGFVPEEMLFEWQADGQSGEPIDIFSAQHGNGTHVSITPSDFEEHSEFICHASTTESQTNVYESEEKRNGLHENFYRANRKQTSLQQAQTILTGLVIGLNTSEVSVQWMKNALTEGHLVNARVLKGSNKDSLLAFSQVIVPYSDWIDGTSYSCRFTHRAGRMKRPEEKSQGEN